MFIEVGKRVKVRDILQGVITVSGNDASVALAEHISGDEKTFSTYMNQMATNLGLTNTNYTNATGLPSDSLYTTAEDISILSRALIAEFPDLYKLYSTKSFEFNDRSDLINKLIPFFLLDILCTFPWLKIIPLNILIIPYYFISI